MLRGSLWEKEPWLKLEEWTGGPGSQLILIASASPCLTSVPPPTELDLSGSPVSPDWEQICRSAADSPTARNCSLQTPLHGPYTVLQ